MSEVPEGVQRSDDLVQSKNMSSSAQEAPDRSDSGANTQKEWGDHPSCGLMNRTVGARGPGSGGIRTPCWSFIQPISVVSSRTKVSRHPWGCEIVFGSFLSLRHRLCEACPSQEWCNAPEWIPVSVSAVAPTVTREDSPYRQIHVQCRSSRPAAGEEIP